jgi:hypothetical protein
MATILPDGTSGMCQARTSGGLTAATVLSPPRHGPRNDRLIAKRANTRLIMATSLAMSRTADHDWRAYLLTAVCTAIFVFTKTNPLIVVVAAGGIGYFGIV